MTRTDDIVRRLRADCARRHFSHRSDCLHCTVADEIERLRIKNASLLAQLEGACDGWCTPPTNPEESPC